MLLTVKDVAERLNVSASCVYQLVESGRLPHHRIGLGRGAIRFSEDDIAGFLHECRQITVIRSPGRKLKHLKL